ncbi:uncharacterized GPI-anchored protein At3g06035 [Selaginella moellendorffii]|uniref:uncharacterized GPI-anchored protein At3g06035 n=1 Tax=Selaginella moellendorffii TaxID=88036 RepID=UPI000D1CF458|nr:uncharacterized GPI-anchored protein At3g06035 [Selaginella moellendorffii]|eukprot:XP_002981119.2 uncharacterized GPI-anchored protein At3g06035 [Selaginella moellendorffii]
MALASPALALPLLLLASSLALLRVRSDDAVESQLLNDINMYRSNLGAPLLSPNPGASCLADKLADHFQHTPCDNVTEAQTSPGLTPDFPDYPSMLADCRLDLANTTGGQVLVDCIPASSDAAGTAFQNFTRSQEYQRFINSSEFSSIGIANEDAWFVLVLGTKASNANFNQSSAAAAGAQLLSIVPIIAVVGAALLSLS